MPLNAVEGEVRIEIMLHYNTQIAEHTICTNPYISWVSRSRFVNYSLHHLEQVTSLLYVLVGNGAIGLLDQSLVFYD